MKKIGKIINIVILILTIIIIISVIGIIIQQNNIKQKANEQTETEVSESNMFSYQIPENDSNSWSEKSVTDLNVSENYFYRYLDLLQYDTKQAYDVLDDEYKKAKFADYEDFRLYVEQNNSIMSQSVLEQYKSSQYNGNQYYICKDSLDRYYIFEEQAVGRYTVTLDNYTVLKGEYRAKYDNETDTNKVTISIERISEAINDGDYHFLYNKLNTTFREENFSTYEEFEEYIKLHWKNNTDIQIEECKKYGENYAISVNLSTIDSTEQSDESKEKIYSTENFIIKLLDNYNFECSFEIVTIPYEE